MATIRPTSRRRPAIALLLVGIVVASASGCSVIRAASAVVSANHALSKMTSQLQASENAKFEVTYTTTGSSPQVVTYAVDPPNDYSYLNPGTSGGAADELVQNSSGFYSCTGESGSGSWQCVRVAAAQQADYATAFQIYTGAYWYGILDVYSSMAALAGVKVQQTSKSVNGFKLSCLVISESSGQGSSGSGTGTYCVTEQGILGYVATSDSSSVFEIKSYTSPPPASAFQLPAGATITTMPQGTSSSVPGSTSNPAAGAGATGASSTTGTSTSVTGSTGAGRGTGTTG